MLIFISPDKGPSDTHLESVRWIFRAPEKGESGILIVCIDKEIDEVLHTLAHEFSHLMQWYEDDPLYVTWDKGENEKNSFNLEVDAEKNNIDFTQRMGIHYNEDAKKLVSDKYIRDLNGGQPNADL